MNIRSRIIAFLTTTSRATTQQILVGLANASAHPDNVPSRAVVAKTLTRMVSDKTVQRFDADQRHPAYSLRVQPVVAAPTTSASDASASPAVNP